MRLTITIPEAQLVEAPTLMRIVRMAPACDVETDEEGRRMSMALVLRGRLGRRGIDYSPS